MHSLLFFFNTYVMLLLFVIETLMIYANFSVAEHLFHIFSDKRMSLNDSFQKLDLSGKLIIKVDKKNILKSFRYVL